MTKAHEYASLQQLLAIRDRRAAPAPIQELLGFDLVDVTDGTAAFSYRPDARHRNPLGTVHGGVAMTLLDSAAGAAVHSTLGAGCGYTTLDPGRGQLSDAAVGSARADASTVLKRIGARAFRRP
jgi:uncharacterized protein (TIGR00369 family)